TVLIGKGAGEKISVPQSKGMKPFTKIFSGSRNTAIGTMALGSNKVDNNTAVGYFSLALNINGEQNTAIGYEALKCNSDGEQNTALGYQALHSKLNGDFNTASGCKSLYSNTSGTYNTAVGLRALFGNTSGSYNLAAGFYSLLNNDTGSENSGLGHGALQNNVAGNQNTATGAFTLYQNSTGSRNTSMGYMSGASRTSNEKCTFVGYEADANGNVINSTAIGSGAMVNDNNQVRLGNDLITSLFCKGAYAATTTNYPNLFVDASGQIMRSTASLAEVDGVIGNEVLSATTNGGLLRSGLGTSGDPFTLGISWGGNGLATMASRSDHTHSNSWDLFGNSVISGQFLGTNNNLPLEIKTYGSLRARITTKGQLEILNTGQSVFIGEGAGANDNLTNSNNAFMGFRSGFMNSTGTGNSATGYQTLLNNTGGSFNSAYGYVTLQSNSTGNYNTAYGHFSLVSLSSGSGNTALGSYSGSTNSFNTYSNCTFIGLQSDAGGNGCSNSTSIGYYSIAEASNYVKIGNSATTLIGGEVGWSTLSDERVKNNVLENVAGLDFIMKLKPVTYNLDKIKQDQIIGREDKSDYPEKYDIEKIRFSGFIAQEVEKQLKKWDTISAG
ncbi:MAG: hypothetical protein FJY10_04685, partial [Bacteroidetes bacterium]|nr:hypothetical protein [Bacteroidota bacterium]